MLRRKSSRQASSTRRQKEWPRESADKPVLDIRRPIDRHLEQSLEAAIRARQERNREKADRAIRELFRDFPELQGRFGVEPKRRGRPLGSRDAPSKPKRRIYVARSFGIPKISILTALGYSPEATAYRLVDRAIAEVEAD